MTGLKFTHILFVCCKSCNCQLSSEEGKTLLWGFVVTQTFHLFAVSHVTVNYLVKKAKLCYGAFY